MKKHLHYIFIGFVVLLFVAAFLFNGKLNRLIGENLPKTADLDLIELATKQVAERYNYDKNGLDYRFTLLEFSSTGCVMCKQMVPVLDEIRNAKEKKINVVFLHIMQPENLPLMKYYGVSAVPMQVLLNGEGKEVFRHYGVIQAAELYVKLVE